jgi:hypothetical protein
MAHLDPYESWKQSRSGLGGPDNLADRVLAALRRQQEEQRQGFAFRLHLLFSAVPSLALRACVSPVGRLAICSLAGAAGLFRILQLVAPFLVERASW